MKIIKKTALTAVTVIAMTGLAACGGEADKTEETSTETAAQQVIVEDGGESELSDETEAEDYEKIEVADYDPDEYVTLGEYKGLELELVKSEVTDDDVEEEIDSFLEEYAEEADKEAAEAGDYLIISYKITVDGQDVEGSEEEDALVQLGEEDLGTEFDEALTGAKAGDTLSIPVVLDDTYGDEYADKEGEYEVEVTQVYTVNMPELTDDFVKENTEYESVDAYREAVRERLIKSYEIENRTEAGEQAVRLAAAASAFTGYPEDLYNRTKYEMEESYDFYASMSGTDRDAWISDEELEAEILDEVNNQITVKAIAKAENLVLDDAAYAAYLEDNLAVYGYSDAASLEADYTREVLEEEALRDMVRSFLIDNGNVTELTAEEYDEKYGYTFDDESEYDDEDVYEEGEDDEVYDDGEDSYDEEYDDSDDSEDYEDAVIEEGDGDDGFIVVLDEEEDIGEE